MSVELVLLAHTVPTRQDWIKAATEVLGGGELYDFYNGSVLIRRADHHSVLTWWPPRQLAAIREAVWAVEDVRTHRVWVDVALPASEPWYGRRICEMVARRVDGIVIERM